MRYYLATILLSLNFTLTAHEVGNELPIPDSIQSTKILQYPSKPTKHFTMEQALELCTKYRSLYSLKYFYIFCGFKWDEKYIKEFGLKEYPSYIFLGTKVTESEGYWGYRRNEEPIWDKYYYSKIEMTEYNKYNLLSLSIWGVGDLEKLKWKTLYPELNPGQERVYATFAHRGEAYLWCREILAEKIASEWKDKSIYDGAKCHVTFDKEIKAYIFEIKSQNPFL